MKKKNSEPPVCPYESIEPNLASQFEWSVNTFKGFFYEPVYMRPETKLKTEYDWRLGTADLNEEIRK